MARLKSDENSVNITTKHNIPCIPNEHRVSSLILLEKFEEKAKSSCVPINSLVDDLMVTALPEQLLFFPSRTALCSAFLRVRHSTFPKLPKTIEDVIVPDQFLKTFSSERFLISRNIRGNDMIVFGSKSDCEALSSAKIIAVDGTFKVSPRLFYQLFIIQKCKC